MLGNQDLAACASILRLDMTCRQIGQVHLSGILSTKRVESASGYLAEFCILMRFECLRVSMMALGERDGRRQPAARKVCLRHGNMEGYGYIRYLAGTYEVSALRQFVPG